VAHVRFGLEILDHVCTDTITKILLPLEDFQSSLSSEFVAILVIA
jgi:hypothetical protein